MTVTYRQKPSQLWQFPLLILSVGLFAVSAYLFINPGHRPTIDEKIAVATDYLRQDRPQAAIEQLNLILTTQTLTPDKEAIVHIMLGEALEAGQNQLKIHIPENYRRIIEQTQLGLNGGAPDAADVRRRLGDSYAALDDAGSAVIQYLRAIALDPEHALSLRRKVVELELASDEPLSAEPALNDYLQQKDLTAAERSWALARKAGLLIEERNFAEAYQLLDQALKLATDPIEQGELNGQLGYCAWKEGHPDQAERYLRLARDQMKSSHPMDGQACYILGRIYQDRNDPQTANSFYDVVLLSHPDSAEAPLAQVGRGYCRLLLGQTDQGLADLHEVTNQLNRDHAGASLKAEAVRGLRKAEEALNDKEDYQDALEVLADEQALMPSLPAEFYLRLGDLYEKRADQINRSITDPAALEANPVSAAEQTRLGQVVRDLRAKAGDGFVAYSRGLTLTDDKGYGEALWHGIDLYDQSGDLPRLISALETFATERPTDKLAPDALLRLGTAYQAAGMFDKAIATFQRNLFRYPKSLAASKSAVPLAQAYLARGPKDFPQAEKVLLSVVEDNDYVDPSAEEFHQALFELAQLYYRINRYEDAIARIEEMMQRYPTDDQLPQLTYLMADSYRKSASLLDVRLATTGPGASEAAEALAAKRDRLKRSSELFDKVISFYKAAPPATDVDKLYQKLSYFYRADCMYDLGHYQEAIQLYEEAAFRYQSDPSALTAYVQIVNSYCALGKPAEAKTANERAKWLLRRMPPDAFENGGFSMPKKYWEDWLKWTSDSGVF